jgi:hypothetical protein
MSKATRVLDGNRCAKCRGFILHRPDALPFCSECQKKIEAEIRARVPKVRGKVLVSERVG